MRRSKRASRNAGPSSPGHGVSPSWKRPNSIATIVNCLSPPCVAATSPISSKTWTTTAFVASPINTGRGYSCRTVRRGSSRTRPPAPPRPRAPPVDVGVHRVAKFVKLSLRNLDANARSIAEYLELGPDERAISISGPIRMASRS